MKKKNLFIGILLCLISTAFAISNAPSNVTKAFNTKFPNATNVKWDKENAHEYEAEFEWAGSNYSANFSDKGEWLETESITSFSQLPEKVQKAFNTSHPGITAKEVSKIENAKGKTIYEVEIVKGMKTQELFYTVEGIETKE